MRTPAEKAAMSAFIRVATTNANADYPDGAAFIPWQKKPQTNRVLWRYLREGRPVLMVGTKELDMLIKPVRTSHLARFRNKLIQRVAVEISCRQKDAPPATDTPPVRAEIGRRALSNDPRERSSG